MQTLHSAVLSTFLVVLVAIIGLSAGHAKASQPAVISPLAQPQDSIGSEALTGVSAQEDAPAPLPLPVADPNPPGDLAAIWHTVSAGGMHNCGIRTDGTLGCWGDNGFGQTDPPDGQFVVVSAGLVQSCAINRKSKLLCWGAESARPKKPPQGRYKDVSAGDVHTCAISTVGTLKCWGDKTLGRLKAPSGSFESLSAGGQHTCAIRTDGRLACWGEKSFMAYERPQGRFKAVTTGEDHACVIRNDDSVVCWGNDAYGQIQAPAGAFKSISAGNFDTCGLRFDGSAECWGRDEMGELEIPAGETFKALSAGGAHVCGLRLDDNLRCWGSNATEMEGVGSTLSTGAQSIPFPLLIQLSGFLGTGLVNHGKGVDKKWEGAEAKYIKLQRGLLAASIIMSVVQTYFMPTPPDPVAESLKRVEADIAELKAAIARIESALKQIQEKLDTLACNVSLQPLVNAGIKIKTAQEIYMRRMDQAQIVINAYAARAKDPKTEVPDVSQDMQKFVDGYEGPLREALNAIHEALVPTISSKTGPLEECMIKSFEQWKSAAKTPFDDSTYYTPVYEILGYALAYQNMALNLLQDIDLWHAQRQLTVGKVDYSPAEMVGYCATVREKAKAGGEKAAYWQQAQASCDDASELTRRTYYNMVAQIERAGAPYTGDHTVLSFGSQLTGKGSDWASQSWLWVRDVDKYGNTGGYFGAELPGTTSKDATHEFRYYPNWVAGGEAWLTVQDIVFHQTGVVDLPMEMDKAGFKHITGRVFWIAGKTFNVSWNDLAEYHPRRAEANTDGMKCFAASGIHHPREKQDIEGVVCKQNQMRNFTWRTTWEDKYGGVNDVGSRPGDDNGYKAYENVLGNFYGRWALWYDPWDGSHIEWKGVQESAAFFPDRDLVLPRWPVIDIAKLECTDSIVPSAGKRKSSNAVGAPTRCGNDRDRVINAIVPRPDSVQARVALPDEVRKVSMSYRLEEEAVVVCHVAENENNDWVSNRYRWEIRNPVQERSAVIDENEQSGGYSYRGWRYLDGLVGDPKVFLVRCASTVSHAPTETRYRVISSWYQFNTETKEFQEYK